MSIPHDLTDLYLAPVTLQLDARIQSLGPLPVEELARRVALESDSADYTEEARADGLMRTLTRAIPLHGWDLSWDPRGLRLSHAGHTLVLGVPGAFQEYLAGTHLSAGRR